MRGIPGIPLDKNQIVILIIVIIVIIWLVIQFFRAMWFSRKYKQEMFKDEKQVSTQSPFVDPRAGSLINGPGFEKGEMDYI